MFKTKYKASMPLIIEELSKEALIFNRSRTDFENTAKCIAFAFNGSRMLSYGINKKKTHPLYSNYADHKKLSTHAEISLLLNLTKVNKIDKVTDILVVRGSTKLLDSYPCFLCYAHILDTFNDIWLWYYRDQKLYGENIF